MLAYKISISEIIVAISIATAVLFAGFIATGIVVKAFEFILILTLGIKIKEIFPDKKRGAMFYFWL